MDKSGFSVKPLVSIVVTSYNHAEYLDQRMQSLLAQTYDNIEIKVVDDCSTDNSAEVLAKYQENSKVHVTLFKENGGYAKACNLGVSLCNGDYIMFAECDDYNEARHVEILMERMLQNPSVGVVYCRSNMVNADGLIYGSDFQYREKLFRTFCSKDVLIPQKMIQKFFLISCVIPNMSAAIIKKEYFQIVDGLNPKYKACADWDFWCRIAVHCDFFYVMGLLNNFRTHLSTVRNTTATSTSVLEIYDILFREYINVNLSFTEQLKFKIAMGSVWAQYIAQNPKNWLKSLPDILLKSIQYDIFMFIYMSLALIKKVAVFTLRQFSQKNKNQNGL
jgi:glycosyltransferase involved in cell wall biosynthesis